MTTLAQRRDSVSRRDLRAAQVLTISGSCSVFVAGLLLSTACASGAKDVSAKAGAADEIKSDGGSSAPDAVSAETDTHSTAAAGTSSHHTCSQPYSKDPRDDTMTGELVRVVTNDNKTPNDPSDDQYEVLLPQEMIDWLNEQNWLQEHGDWHNVRRCAQSCQRSQVAGLCQSMEALNARGLACAPIQEGEPGDGYDFLAMHRHMIRGFQQAFPKHVEQIRGFYRIPKSKDDPENPIPWVNVRWSDAQLETIDWMENIAQHSDAFTGEDDYAKWVQFGDRQFGMGGGPGSPGGFPDGGLPPGIVPGDGGVPGFPGGGLSGRGDADLDAGSGNPFGAAVSAADGNQRNSGGIHGGLHGQWSVPGSPSSLVNNNTNVQNFAFWRLHVWIDEMWERYRRVLGVGEDDPHYQQALIDQCEEMHELGNARPLENQDAGPAPTETGVFATEVAPTFSSYCGGSVCHGADSPTLGLALAGTRPSIVREGLVGQPASESALSLVEPGQPEQSWLYLKLTGNFAGIDCNTSRCTSMPPAGTRPSDEEIERIRAWIAAGATAD